MAAARGATPINLELGSCELRGRLVPRVGRHDPGLELRLIGPGASAVREAFEPDGRYGAALLNAELRVEPIFRGVGVNAIPKGRLLTSHSARRVGEGHWRWHAGSASLRWEGPDAPLVPVSSSACASVSDQSLFLWLGTLDLRPGEMIARRPLIARGRPGAFDPLEASCVTRWSLSPGAPASVHPALGVAVINEVRDNSPSPTHFSLFAHVGSRRVEGKVAVFQPALQPLVGSWRQVSERLCGARGEQAPGKPILELEFAADGVFRLTWLPFEARYDFWGSYRHDPDSGAIEFSVDGGNAGTRFTQAAGTAVFRSPRDLVISNVDPGSMTPAGQSLCAMSFTRVK